MELGDAARTTFETLHKLARALNVDARQAGDVGSAGR
jgi:hypothetical protein